MYKPLKHTRTALLLLAITMFAFACVSDNLLDEFDSAPQEEEMPDFGDDVYSLNFVATLDNMGSSPTRAITDKDPEIITRYENYINLERFRILFFDKNDKFLFESKNRWVKQIDSNDEYSGWFISVPLGPFGNDSYQDTHAKEYNWDDIRDKLTEENSYFKIAILANRPAQLLYPGTFSDSTLELPEGVFDNDGPYWGPDDVGKRDIFDLHHYQYDIIYADKGKHADGGSNGAFYDFIMGDINTTRPTMGSAINWVSFDKDDNDKVVLTSSTAMRHVKMPSEDHPIPMYGIQIFPTIPKDQWKKGSPFDLSNLQDGLNPGTTYIPTSVSLLRSCVRLDLVIPKTIKNGQKPKFVSLWYSNIYSRTEPMNTWTPTNQLWKDKCDSQCELNDLINFGAFVSSSVVNETTKLAYQNRLSWFYGAWKQKGWEYKTLTGSTITPPAASTGGGSKDYPQIFNTCIQRNKVITCERGYVDGYNDNCHHWVVYTGERNNNDPNTLPNMEKPYIICWIISWDSSNYYCIPLLNYGSNNDADRNTYSVFGPHTDKVEESGNWPSKMTSYMNSLPAESKNNLPYPLMRNHIYRFTLTGKSTLTRAEDDLSDISIESEVLQTPDIGFSEQVKKLPRTALPQPRAKQKR